MILSVLSFDRWFGQAKPGDAIVYFGGNLAVMAEMSPAAAGIRAATQLACRDGLIELTQKLRGPQPGPGTSCHPGWDYIATKRRAG